MDRRRPAPLEAVMDLLLDAVCVVDEFGHFVFVSAAFERIFGYRCDEVIGRRMIDLVLPEDRERTQRAAAEIMSGAPKPSFENRYVRKDGAIVHILWSARWSESERLRVAIAHDITARRRAGDMQAAMYAMSEAAHVATDLFDLLARAHRIVADLLPAERMMVGVRNEIDGALNIAYAADAQGDPVDGLPSRCIDFCADVVTRGEIRLMAGERGETWLGAPLVSADGCLGALALKRAPGAPVFTERDRELLNFVATQIATALERMQLQTRLRRMAQYDGLTGLPNRALLHDRIETAIAAARRARGRLALLYLDLDRFKEVNDTLGHAAGDVLLHDVAQRLRQCVRDADTVARIGGDEFVMLSEGAIDAEVAGRLAQRLVDAASQPMLIGTHEIQVSASVGVALFPDDGDENRVLVCADTAMYAAKHAGRNTWRLYCEDMDGGSADILGMQRAIRRALDNDEFVLHYQPKVSAVDGELRGVEALIRWQDPERGMVPPVEFIPVAERFGLINAIGFWTLREACGQIRSWMHAGRRIPVAVNLSPQQFRQPDLVERVRACIDEFDIDPGLLALEITESVVMESSTSVRRVLEELKAMGVTLSIDDFGTGYSCLAYLCRLPARQLKIDRTFVIDMDHVAEARHVVEAVIRLAHSLRMEVVAEGVERSEQVVALRALGCDLIQGYYFSRPVPAGEIETLLHSRQLGDLSNRARSLGEGLQADAANSPQPLELAAG